MRELGLLVARAITGAWRESPPAPTLTRDELETVASQLMATGTSGLGWWAIRDHEELATTEAAKTLHDGFRVLALHRNLYETKLAGVLNLVNGQGIDPLLLKGWSIAQSYPSRGLRPCGDVDLVVPADRHVELQAVLDDRPVDKDWIDVDLEHRFLTVEGTSQATLAERATRVKLETRSVKVPGPEDALRLVCVHFLHGGGWQPRALCDVALLLETRPPDLDWDVVLDSRLHRQWVTVAIGLAVDLLGADARGTPLEDAPAHVPGWVREHVLRGFATTSRDHFVPRPAFRPTLTPNALRAQLRDRWASDDLWIVLHHGRRIPPRTSFGIKCFDAVYRAVALLTPVKLKQARRDGSPELAR